MSRHVLNRRQVLMWPVLVLAEPLLRAGRARAAFEPRQAGYDADVALLYHALHFHLAGTIDETLDQEAGRYRVIIAGQGSGIANRIESIGVWRGGRWTPEYSLAWFEVAGRQSRSETRYDYDRRQIDYHFRGETFLLRRVRIADDTLPLPATSVDDLVSAMLNFAGSHWPPRPDGALETRVVRRRRPDAEGADEVEKTYRAELVPLVVRVTPTAGAAKSEAAFDLTRFSSWARPEHPAQVVFSPERRPETISATLILGTVITIQVQAAARPALPAASGLRRREAASVV